MVTSNNVNALRMTPHYAVINVYLIINTLLIYDLIDAF